MIEDDIRIALLDADIPGILEYANLPRTIGALISAQGGDMLHLCETVYSVEDVYLMVEVLMVDAHNKAVADKYFKDKET